ncbi:hypothetical protein [Algoriphagus antarcticus]|nr:hypothetical protein [Algoriphagus antarcticus]
MEFNKLQKKLWIKMLKSIESYRSGGTLLFSDFIYGLEGYLDAGEFQDESLILQWYNYWTPLEIFYSTNGDDKAIEEIDKYLSEMESFLKSKI